MKKIIASYIDHDLDRERWIDKEPIIYHITDDDSVYKEKVNWVGDHLIRELLLCDPRLTKEVLEKVRDL